MKKLFARWVQSMLTDEQKKRQFDISRVNHEKFQTDQFSFSTTIITLKPNISQLLGTSYFPLAEEIQGDNFGREGYGVRFLRRWRN